MKNSHLQTEEVINPPGTPSPVVHREESESITLPEADEIEAIALEVTHSVKAHWHAVFRGTAILTASLIGLSLILHITPGGYEALGRLLSTPAFLVLFLCIAVWAILYPLFYKTRHGIIDEALVQEDIRCIGPLIQALSIQDDRSAREIKTALTRLLPNLKASDAGLLTRTHIAKLRTYLSRPIENPFYKDVRALLRPDRNRANFQIAILKAFQQIGGEKELAVVDKLATGEARTGLQQEIRRAARECLPYLQARVEQERVRQTLLRPSESSEPMDTLLRPALGTTSEDSGRLLRPELPPEEG